MVSCALNLKEALTRPFQVQTSSTATPEAKRTSSTATPEAKNLKVPSHSEGTSQLSRSSPAEKGLSSPITQLSPPVQQPGILAGNVLVAHNALSPVKDLSGNDKSHALAEGIMRTCFQRGLGLNLSDPAMTGARHDAMVLAIQSKNLLGLRSKISKEREGHTQVWQDLIKKFHHQLNTADLVRLYSQNYDCCRCSLA